MSLQKLHQQLVEEIADIDGRISYFISFDEEEVRFHEHALTSPASTIKVPIMVEALRLCNQGRLSLKQQVEIKVSDRVGGSGVLKGMDLTSLTLRDLLTLMIVVSDNTATNIVIDLIGMEQLNVGFRQIGLTSTALKRKMMDLEKLHHGIDTVTTANDLHHCLKLVNETALLSEDSKRVFCEIMKAQQFQHKLPFYMDEQKLIVMNKTGSITGVENDCGIFQIGDRTVYAAVLCQQLQSEQDGIRFIQLVGKKISSLLEEGIG